MKPTLRASAAATGWVADHRGALLPRHDPPDAETGWLLRRLAAVHRRAFGVALGAGLSATVLALVVTCALTLLLDRLFDLPVMGRFLCIVTVVMVAAMGLALGVVRVLLSRKDEDVLALRVEGHFGGMQSLLISALQLGRPGGVGPGASEALVDVVKQQAVERTADVNFLSVVGLRGLRRLGLAALAALALAGGYSAVHPQVVRVWVGRLLHPFDLTRVYPTQTQLLMLTGDLAVPAGDFATVAVRGTGRVPATGALRYWQAGGVIGQVAARADTTDLETFRVRLGPIAEDTWYRFEVGDARTSRSLIEALPRPRLTDLVLTPRLPPYVRAPDPPAQRIREVQALVSTEMLLQGQTQVPGSAREGQSGDRRVERAALILASGSRMPMQVAPDGAISGRFMVRQDDAYQIVLAYDHVLPTAPATADPGRPAPDAPSAITVVSDRPVWYAVHAVPDKPPTVKIVEPGPTVDASPVGEVGVKVEMTDDYGVEEAHLWYAVRHAPPTEPTGEPEVSESSESGEPPAATPVPSPPAQAPSSEPIDRRAFTRVALAGRFGSRQVTVAYDWLVARTGARPGDRILYYISAADGRQEVVPEDAPGAGPSGAATIWRDNPNVTESEMYEIAVVSMEEIERQLREKRQAVWDDVYRIYVRERELRGEVEDIRKPRPTSRPTPASMPAAGE